MLTYKGLLVNDDPAGGLKITLIGLARRALGRREDGGASNAYTRLRERGDGWYRIGVDPIRFEGD